MKKPGATFYGRNRAESWLLVGAHTMSEYRTKTKRGQSNALYSESGQVVATMALDKGGVLCAMKRISSSRHALRTPPALAVDACVLDQAEQKGCRYFRVFDQDTGTTYRADLETFRANGFDVNRGFGPQVALTFAFWSVIGPDGNVVPRIQPKPTDPSTVRQGDLFNMGGQA